MRPLLLLALVALVACAGAAPLPEEATYGPEPQLVAPQQGLLPEINVPEAVGWNATGAPIAPEGFVVTRYAQDLAHPRWLYVLPNGDVLVAESSSQRTTRGGVEGWMRNAIGRRGGTINVSANRITLLRDDDGDGDVDMRAILVESLNQPFGMALVNGFLYVGNTDAVVRFPYRDGQTHIDAAPEHVLPLPHSSDGHWTRNLLANADGSKIYVAVGSMSNVGDQGMEVEDGRAAIHEFNPDGSGDRIFASGLRNPNGMDWEPATGRLWTAVNERDMLGADLVPDYMTSVGDGEFFGWPWTYWGDHLDPRFEENERPTERIAAARRPDYALGAHTASLGLMFYRGMSFPEHYRGGVFIGQHGSWNRSQPSGYKVLYVPFANGQPEGMPEAFLQGFLNERGQAMGRPAGIAMDRTGALLVADDAGDIIWRVAYARPTGRSAP